VPILVLETPKLEGLFWDVAHLDIHFQPGNPQVDVLYVLRLE
jgi:hypothetical protein